MATDPLTSLRKLLKTPAPAGGDQVPPALRAALMEIVAEALRGGEPKRDWDIPGVTYEGYPVGSYRVTIEKTA